MSARFVAVLVGLVGCAVGCAGGGGPLGGGGGGGDGETGNGFDGTDVVISVTYTVDGETTEIEGDVSNGGYAEFSDSFSIAMFGPDGASPEVGLVLDGLEAPEAGSYVVGEQEASEAWVSVADFERFPQNVRSIFRSTEGSAEIASVREGQQATVSFYSIDGEIEARLVNGEEPPRTMALEVRFENVQMLR